MRSPYGFEHLYQQAACGLILTHANGEIIHANTTFCRYLGYEEQDLHGKRIQDLFTVGGRFFHYTHWSPLLQMQGSVAEVQMDLVRADGQTIPMLINAFRREFEGEYFHELSALVASDRKKYERELLMARGAAETALTEMRLLQLELEKNRDILSVAMRSAQMGLWSMRQGEALWCSPELKHILGLPPDNDNLSFDNFLGLMHNDDRISVRACIENAITQLSDYTTEFRLTATAPQRLMQMRGRAAKDGQDVQIFGIAIDVTELRASELAVNKLNDELAVADRRKDEFLATLAHELRNPLTPILNVSEIIKTRAEGDTQLEWASAVVAKQVTQLTHLIDDLMDISRITQGRLVLRKETVRLADVIQRAIDDVQHLIPKQSIDLRVELLNTDISLSIDPTRLTQIISNLLTNAAKYTPAQGIISLRAEVSDSEFTLWVRDTGIGIAQESLPKIFKMFSQLKPAIERSQGGLGIGLALCRGLAELHGGSLEAHSEGEGKGSEFLLRIPVLQETDQPAQSEIPIQPITKQRVLIVDDNVDAAATLARLLELLDCETCLAHDGTEALLKGKAFFPDITLLDIGLPDLNGYEVARRMRAIDWGKKTLLIATTGWGQEKDKRMAEEAGFDKHITKPINLLKLREILANEAAVT